jgi:acetylornithine/N-succinyldiaminopimelate aminotransferase
MTTQMTTAEILSAEDKFSVPSYSKWPCAFVRGAGCYVYDADGNEYLDFYGGHCVTLLGHCHPAWVSALTEQAQRLGFYSNSAYSDTRARFLERLIAFAPAHLEQGFLCNSGAEANETAVKLALKATRRREVIAMEGSFHGRTAGALSLTHLGHYREQFPQVTRETRAVRFGDLQALERCLTPDTAAVILEPVQSMAGIRMAEPDYYRGLVEACHRNGTLVIFDEIQTGMGRLGAPFAADLFHAQADLVTLAKGLGNGFPVAAVLATASVAETVEIGDQGTTFGGGPLACAAGLAVLETIEREGLVSRATRMERAAREHLVTGPVTGIRGRGLLLGLETEIAAKDLCRYLFSKKMLAGTSADPHVARLMPALVISEKEIVQLGQTLRRFPD